MLQLCQKSHLDHILIWIFFIYIFFIWHKRPCPHHICTKPQDSLTQFIKTLFKPKTHIHINFVDRISLSVIIWLHQTFIFVWNFYFQMFKTRLLCDRILLFPWTIYIRQYWEKIQYHPNQKAHGLKKKICSAIFIVFLGIYEENTSQT